jgi:hypothetical protein
VEADTDDDADMANGHADVYAGVVNTTAGINVDADVDVKTPIGADVEADVANTKAEVDAVVEAGA